MSRQPIPRAKAKDELVRISDALTSPHLLIGGLAVQQYHPPRISEDIDLVCSFEVTQTLLKTLYPSSDWRIADPRDDDYRPAYEITHRVDPRGCIKFGPKITQRESYNHIDWFTLKQRGRPFMFAGSELVNILVPSADALAFTKLISFIGRQHVADKAVADLQDFVDLTNHDSFSANCFLDHLRKTGKGPEIMADFRAAASGHQDTLQQCCLYHLLGLFIASPATVAGSVPSDSPSGGGESEAPMSPPSESGPSGPPFQSTPGQARPSAPTEPASGSPEKEAAPSPKPIAHQRVTPEYSTPFFHERMCDAFPGVDRLLDVSDQREAFTRLKALFEHPILFAGYSPLWEVGHGTMHIQQVDLDSPPILKLGHHRYILARLAGYRSMAYWRDFALLNWAADVPTGLYDPPNEATMEEYAQQFGACTEEYGVWGSQLVSRSEHDDGQVYRDGELKRISSKLEVRNLTSGWMFLCAQRSPLNDVSNDLARWEILNRLRLGEIEVSDVANWVESLPKHRREDD